MASTIRTTRVGIDPESHRDVFTAQVDDRSNNWNGWACPSFAPSEARRVEAWLNENNGARSASTDSYTYNVISVSEDGRYCTVVALDGVTSREDNDRDEVYVEVLENLEGLGLAIGSWCWTWSECDDLPTDPAEIDTALQVSAAFTEAYCRTWNTALHAGYAERPGDAEYACAKAAEAVRAAGLA